MVLPNSLLNGMDAQVPVMINNSVAGAEPFRMELAALIGAKLNDSVTTLVNASTGVTPAPYQYRSSQAPATPWQQQLRLNINRVLAAADSSLAFGMSAQQFKQNPLQYRELTPHPTAGQWGNCKNPTTPIGTTLGATGAPSTAGANAALLFPTTNSGTAFSANDIGVALQEYWARRDRQQMARDIYVMLYMFGGGLESEDFNNNGKLDPGEDLNLNGQLDLYVNFAALSNKSNALYQSWQLYEMAQFAVNIVDSLDRDNVISMFEFDMDLQDGWSLDDDPTTNDNNNVDRGIVFGVEAQQLAFNEVLVALSRRVPSKANPANYVDHLGTLFDDHLTDRTFTYLELYNVSPYSVPVNGQNWQVLLLDPTNPVAANGGPLSPKTSNAVSVLTFNDFNQMSIAAGQPYTIASRTYTATGVNETNPGGATFHGSAFVVDTTWDPSANPNSNPNFANKADASLTNYWVIPAPGGSINLDLVGSAKVNVPPTENNQPFILTQANTDAGNLLGGQAAPADQTVGDFCDLTLKTSAPGAHVYDVNADNGLWNNSTPIQFVLRRRLNLDRPAPHILTDGNYSTNDADNPYIEVDRMSYTTATAAAGGPAGPLSQNNGQYFNPVDPTGSTLAATQTDLASKLPLLNSRERKQPLDGDEGSANWGTLSVPLSAPPTFYFNGAIPTANATKVRVPYYYVASGIYQTPNSIGQANWATTNADGNGISAPMSFTLWQPHFDRDYASLMELLSVPLYSPNFVTRSQVALGANGTTFHSLIFEYPLPATVGNDYIPLAAQSKFLKAQHPTNVNNAAPNPQLDNRWYRVLELLEVPPQENLQVETTLLAQYPWLFPQALQRTTGKMNLGGMRYGENLFALLDDSTQFSTTVGYNANTGSYADNYENGRDWWSQFLQARDVLDPTTGLFLPGTPSSRPMRSLSHFDSAPAVNKLSSTDDTLLRRLPQDVNNLGAALDKRGLFEARAQSDLASQGGAAGNTIDHYTRQRLLSKIAGNTTPRSNVFLVWITVGFFEAYEAVPAQVNNAGKVTQTAVMQIGAEMQDQTRHRGFFVVDRSLLEDAWVPVLYQRDNKNNVLLDVNNNPLVVPGTGIYDFSKFVRYRKTLQ
jgi:hypothetical protein